MDCKSDCDCWLRLYNHSVPRSAFCIVVSWGNLRIVLYWSLSTSPSREGALQSFIKGGFVMGNASRKSDKVSAFDNLESRVLLSGTTVAYWRFEEGTAGKAASGAAGAILDSSGNGLNGTAVDGPVYESTVPTATIPQTGQADKLAMDFNGTDQRISIPNYSALAFTGSFTIEAYIDVEKTTSG